MAKKKPIRDWWRGEDTLSAWAIGSSEADQEQLSRMAAIILPLGAAPKGRILPGAEYGAKWADYTFHLFGMEVPYSSEPPPYPAWLERPSDGSPPKTLIQLWLITFRVTGCPLVGLFSWRPDQGSRMRILGLEHPHSQEEVLKIDRGLAFMVKRITRRGPPFGKFLDDTPPEDFIRKCAEVRQTVWERDDRPATQLDIAEAYGFSDRKLIYKYCQEHHIERYCKEHHIHYPPWR